jgi:hypothetical protein
MLPEVTTIILVPGLRDKYPRGMEVGLTDPRLVDC